MAMNRPAAIDGALQIEPFRPANVHQTIQERLTQYIRGQRLAAGDRLPSQAALARALGVSQVALREAMRAMEALGIIEARAGSGWYVRDFSFDAAARGLAYSFQLNGHDFADLIEIRIRLECSYLPEVLPRLSDDDLAALEQAVQEMERLAAAGQDFDEPDRAFHMRLFADKVDNQLFVQVLDLFWTLFPRIAVLPEPPEQGVLVADAHGHRLILEALRAGDVNLAARRLLDSLHGAEARASRSAPQA